ncbi:MAG: hypothetical protein DMG51_19955 [Acidobacteria bacterium]|nr:MAG: hypothetical protein DMG51_19955 [Acidobacteriota bacterium]
MLETVGPYFPRAYFVTARFTVTFWRKCAEALVLCKIADSLNRIESLYHGRRWLVQRSDLALYDNSVKAGLKL